MSKPNRVKARLDAAKRPAAVSMGKTSARLFVAAIVLFVATRCYVAFVMNPAITDITLYFEYSSRAIDRQKEPYRDFAVEYPPVAWWSMCIPRLVDERRLTTSPHSPVNAAIFRDYHQAYRLEMALCDVAAFGLFLAIVRKRRPQSAGWAAMTYVVTSTILCHVLYDHLDEGTLLFSMLGMYAWTQTLEPRRSGSAWSAAAFFFFGLGFSFKIIPVIAVPFLLLAEWRNADRGKRLAAGLAGLALGMGGPFAIQCMVSGPGVFDLFSHHAGRGIQVESLYSTLMWIGSLFGQPISISLSTADGAYCVFGSWLAVMTMKVLSILLLCGFLGAAGICAILRRSRLGRAEAFGLACYALGGCAVFSKVFSPQYFVWSIPLLLLAGVEALPEKPKSAWTLAGLLILAAGLTTWIFPYHYFCAPLGPRGTPISCGLIPASPEEPLAPSSLGYAVLAAQLPVLGGRNLAGRSGFRPPQCRSTAAGEPLEKSVISGFFPQDQQPAAARLDADFGGR